MKKKNTNKKLFIAFMILLFLIIEGIDLNRENSSAKLDEKDVKKSKLSYEINNIEKSKIIDNVITYCQYPNYPTGCESVALYILLKYYNVPITMEKIVNNLPKGDLPYDEKGNRYGGNPNIEFVGNPKEKYSFGVYNEPIKDVANLYKTGAISETGVEFDKVLQLIDENRPVIVWITIDLKETSISTDWIYKKTGETIKWLSGEHAVVVCGYTNKKIIVSDSYTGEIRYLDRTKFIQRYNDLGKRVVYY